MSLTRSTAVNSDRCRFDPNQHEIQ